MTFVRHIRVTMSGYLGSPAPGAEIWSSGFSLSNGADASLPSDNLTDTAWAGCIAFASSFMTDANMHISNQATLTLLKGAYIETTGHYVGPPREDGSIVTGGGSGLLPPQCSRVITLVGPPAVHRKHGRLFSPMPSVNLSSATLEDDATRCAEVAADFASLFPGGVLADGFKLVIASQRPVPANWPVSQIKVGRVVDTMRTRRNKLRENYEIVDL